MKLAVIRKNNIDLVSINFGVLVYPLLYKQSNDESKMLKNSLERVIWEKLLEYVTFIECDTEFESIEKGCVEIVKGSTSGDHETISFNTETSFITPKNMYQYIYGIEFNSDSKEINITNDNMNHYGSIINLDHKAVAGTIVLIKYEYVNEQLKMADVNEKDVTKLFRKRYCQSTILIKPDETLVKYYYQTPDKLISTVLGDAEQKSLTIFNYTLHFTFRKDATVINPIATRMLGMRVYGDVLIFHETREGVFGQLSRRELKRLNVLSYANTIELKQEQQPWEKYALMNLYIKDFNDKKTTCMKCNGTINTLYQCTKCYRIRICSPECFFSHPCSK